MHALFIDKICDLRIERRPLTPGHAPDPVVTADEIVLKVGACGVCHTELDEIEGRTPPSFFPVIPGHQVVGRVVERGARVTRRQIGDRVGVGWIFSACGVCTWCRTDRENLCEQFRATGRDAHGGYAEFIKVREAFAIPIPAELSDSEAAPLLCAGAIGYRSLRLAGIQDGQTMGLTGFGASAHLVLKMVRHQYPKADVFVFARSEQERLFARELGAAWSGDTEETPPELLDAIIDTTPVWRPIVAALKNLKSGGRLVINAIRKEDADKYSLLGLDYPHHLWLEKEIKSVANVTRRDIQECLDLAARIPIKPEYREYGLEEANQALLELKEQKIRGAKVLKI